MVVKKTDAKKTPAKSVIKKADAPKTVTAKITKKRSVKSLRVSKKVQTAEGKQRQRAAAKK